MTLEWLICQEYSIIVIWRLALNIAGSRKAREFLTMRLKTGGEASGRDD